MAPEDLYAADAGTLYDAAYERLRGPSGDVAFYRALARTHGGPVLELGCGSGRVLLPIARDGVPCVGLDASEAMLDALRAKSPPPNLRLVQGSMQDLDMGPQRFPFIFSAFRAFQHLLTVGDQLACLERVRRHLAPGGLFAFDVFAPRFERVALAEEPETEDVRFPLDADEVVRYARVRRDRATQTQEVVFRYERRHQGVAVGSTEARVFMRYFFRYEREHLLGRAGFSRLEFLGGFDGRPYDYVSGEMIVLARAES